MHRAAAAIAVVLSHELLLLLLVVVVVDCLRHVITLFTTGAQLSSAQPTGRTGEQ